MEYDGILRRDEDGDTCIKCAFSSDCNRNGLPCQCDNSISPCKYEHYANAVQLKGLIEEAEAGGYPAMKDVKWICTGQYSCKRPREGENTCRMGGIGSRHPRFSGCEHECSYLGLNVTHIPYRGTRREEQTWPGINGETHLEALREIAAKANPTAVDCSEVELFVCGNSKCPNKLCNNRPASEKEWKASGCVHISLVSVNSGSIKEDRSDLEYNKKSEFLRDEAGEVINSGGIEIVIKDDLSPLSDIKVTAEVQEDGVEYVVAEHLSLRTLAFSNMSAGIFREFFKVYNEIKWSKGEAFAVNDTSAPFATELIRCGFIERKVDDPVVKLGDTFENNAAIFQASWAGVDHEMSFIVIKIKDKKDALNLGSSCDSFGSTPFKGNLSEIVGKDRLSEFKPCKVEIAEITE